jgi:hypothetical protein
MRPTGKPLISRRDQPPILKAISCLRFRSSRLPSGYSLMEVVLATAIIALVYGAIIECYMQAGLRAEWTGYSLAAQSLATEQIEQARSALWDPNAGSYDGTNISGVNQITQLNLSSWSYTSSNSSWSGYSTGILDVPYGSTNYTIATNYVTVQAIYLNNQTNPPVQVEMITVKTVWPFKYRGTGLVFTNTAATWVGPDNRSIDSM